ncbi:MAG: hypothetical protein EXQ90_06815 [Rhodospirillales bacterium]|nr:hypothetical protein [Rhodospirillales bacterium]
MPIPLGLYVGGAGAAVALSFVVMAIVMGASHTAPAPRVDLMRFAFVRGLTHPAVVGVIRVFSVALFLLVLATAFFGTPNPFRNFAPTMVWVIAWVGLAYISVLFGDIWAVVNPWSITFAWAEALYRRRGGRALNLGWRYPERLGVWPAVVLALGFAWMELIWDRRTVPASLGLALVEYSLITWFAMLAFGRDTWLRCGEVFAVLFGLFARFAPTDIRATENGAVSATLRPYGVGLIPERPVEFSYLVFMIAVLATVSLDGLMATPAWQSFVDTYYLIRQDWPAMQALDEPSGWLFVAVRTAVLALWPLLFLAIYIATAWLMARAVSSATSAPDVAGWFVLTLVPIAIAYHLAHYLGYLLINGQRIVALASDPFGVGWDLWGTAEHTMDIGLVGARFAWYTAVAAIIVGHVVAVYLAHAIALRVFPDRRAALRSQIPLIVLIVAYTMTGLWILAQPIAES